MEDTVDFQQFELAGLDLLSAGLLESSFGCLLVYPPLIEPSRGFIGQDRTTEMTNVVIRDLADT